MIKTCKVCGKTTKKTYGIGAEQWKQRKYCSRECFYKSRVGKPRKHETKKKISESLRNEKHFNWKENATYGIVHYWLRQNYGQPTKCQNCKQNKKCQWALAKGKKYERNRENFIPLCIKCHRRYDFVEKLRPIQICIDCGKELKGFYSKRCNSHAQKERFRRKKQMGGSDW